MKKRIVHKAVTAILILTACILLPAGYIFASEALNEAELAYGPILGEILNEKVEYEDALDAAFANLIGHERLDAAGISAALNRDDLRGLTAAARGMSNAFDRHPAHPPSHRFAQVHYYIERARAVTFELYSLIDAVDQGGGRLGDLDVVIDHDRMEVTLERNRRMRAAEYIRRATDEIGRVLEAIEQATTPSPQPAQPSSGQALLRLSIGSVTYTHNGIMQTAEVAPFIRDGRTMVPLRIVAEALGADVAWDGPTRTVTIVAGGNTLRLVIDTPLPGDMGTPVIVGGFTFVPARYVSEMLGASVRWDGANQAVYVYSGPISSDGATTPVAQEPIRTDNIPSGTGLPEGVVMFDGRLPVIDFESVVSDIMHATRPPQITEVEEEDGTIGIVFGYWVVNTPQAFEQIMTYIELHKLLGYELVELIEERDGIIVHFEKGHITLAIAVEFNRHHYAIIIVVQG